MQLRPRTRKQIEAEYGKYWDKVWWNRHWSVEREVNVACCDKARCIEDKYGKAFLHPGNDIDWGICLGKLEALAWMLGADWDEAGDT